VFFKRCVAPEGRIVGSLKRQVHLLMLSENEISS
jgi:hypothetical protein